MIYHGFSVRDYLILENLTLEQDSTVLEIGIGTGSTVQKLSGKIRKYHGIDISEETISWLTNIYKNQKSLTFSCHDVCDHSLSLDTKFDIIFSADTLEHVSDTLGYFNFINRHLTDSGLALITFPNESEEKHHGITWFKTSKELSDIIKKSGLEITDFFQVEKSNVLNIIENVFINLPKRIIRRRKSNVQTFEQTDAFKINKSKSIIKYVLCVYSNLATKIASFFKLYHLKRADNEISNKILLIKLKKRNIQ
jgi:2-polyprenyl-3-methyl-5-hydroxy-6-metoxy-1,4-benzoquinol methylase